MDAKTYLLEWIERFIKNKDLVMRKLEKCVIEDNKLICHHKDNRIVAWLVIPFLEKEEEIFSELEEYDYCALVCYNTQQNFDFLINNWEKLVNFKRNFHIYFVNPFSVLEKRWTIFPHTHNTISEGINIKETIQVIANNVEQITEEKVMEIIK